MKRVFVCLAMLIAATASEAQTLTQYIIKFTSKAGTPYSLATPLNYLSQRAVDRRSRYSIAVDSSDLPVTPRYVDSVRAAGSVTILNVSRWLNQVSIQTTDAAALQKIRSFPFVQSADAVASRMYGNNPRTQAITKPMPLPRLQRAGKTQNPKLKTRNTAADFYNYGQSYNQVHIHNGEFLHNIGLRGEGMIIGMLDGGFRNYTSLRAFDSINAAGQVLGTYDFVARETSVIEDDPHGMQCLSVIAANIPGQFVGSAPKADFYLFRSEDGASEYQIEEHNWVVAAERLDSAGGDLISSSLGYSDGMSSPQFDHTYAEMNGNTTIAARGADLAAAKGILVVNSAGNQGNDGFKYISSPADGDSVMAVGAVNSNGAVAGFSSYGPSSDGQVKPDVASVGVNTVVQNTNNAIGNSSGTSFSCPNIAGLAACLWQGFREYNNIKILNALRQSGSKATSPDDRVGYGIPDVKKAVMQLVKEYSTASAMVSNCRVTVSWTTKDMSAMRYEIERRAPGETSFTKIKEAQGTGPVFGNRSYSTTDTLINVQAGTVSYRIRQIIDTAALTFIADYTDTMNVTLASSCITTAVVPVLAAGESVTVSPNPSINNFTLSVATLYPVQRLAIRVANNKGQIVEAQLRSKASGSATYTLPANRWASGTYYVSVYNNSTLLATREVIKL